MASGCSESPNISLPPVQLLTSFATTVAIHDINTTSLKCALIDGEPGPNPMSHSNGAGCGVRSLQVAGSGSGKREKIRRSTLCNAPYRRRTLPIGRLANIDEERSDSRTELDVDASNIWFLGTAGQAYTAGQA